MGIKKIIVPGDFTSHKGGKAVNCSVKAAEGYLYPMKSSLVFIHKPVIYIRHVDLKHVEFSRTGAGAWRTFDLNLTHLKGEQNITFTSIDREEHKILVQYFKQNNIKMKTVDLEGNRSELAESKADKDKEADTEMNEYNDEEGSEDESFDDKGQEDSEDGSDSEASGSGGNEIDEEMDKDEAKELQKENGKVDVKSGRAKRNHKK